MITTYPLEAFLKGGDAEQENIDSLCQLFRVAMSVADVSVKDLLEQLLILREEGYDDVARVTEMYKYLDDSLVASDEIR